MNSGILRLRDDNCLFRMDNNRRVLMYAAVVSLLALVLSVPKFFEYSVKFRPTDMSKSKGYQVYDKLFRGLFLLGIVPFATLIGLYTKIYLVIKGHRKTARELKSNKNDSSERQKQSKMAKVFAGIVVTFLVCHTPREVFFNDFLPKN